MCFLNQFVVPIEVSCLKEHPVCPGNFCHAPGLGNASPREIRIVPIKDLGYVTYTSLPHVMKDRDKNPYGPFPWDTLKGNFLFSHPETGPASFRNSQFW